MPADVIEYEIIGDDMQAVIVELDPGEAVQAEAGALLYMENGVEMQTSMGGLDKGLRRMFTGESFFITTFANQGSAVNHAAFGAPYPGHIIPLDLGELEGSFLVQKDAFLCCARGIEIEVAFTKRLGAGVFGGEGFILQRLRGDGLAFVHAGGAVIRRDLAAGETLRVDTGCLVGMAGGVDYDIQFVGGWKNALFGGEGIFFAKVTGPGRVYLQSLPFSRMADRIAAAFRGSGREEKKGLGGIAGGILGNVLQGDKNY